jgi:diketogulonate reductase-like aldo/keto reductase
MLRLRQVLDEHDIKIEAYSPLTSLFRSTGGPVDPVVSRIANERGVTDAQVLLAWAKQHGGGVDVTCASLHV